VFSLAALGKERDYDARARLAGVGPDDAQLRDLKQGGERASRLADIGYTLGLVGAAFTIHLFQSEGRGESRGSLKIGVGPASAMARVSF
jgi:hypothetical protein